VYFGTEALDLGRWCFPPRISILRPPFAFPVPGRDRQEGEETDGETERKKERGRETRRRDLVFFLFFILVSSLSEGGTDDSDSCAKSYSFGPSTTWPGHNRVKVASRLSPRGGFRSARKVEKKEKEEKKHLTRAEWKSEKR